VNFGEQSGIYGTDNVFIAEPGSVVNGNVILGGGGDTFVTSLINNGPGQFAGVTGAVTGLVSAGYPPYVSSVSDTLKYLVTANATATLALPTLFGALDFDLANNATATISLPNSTLSTIGFAGTGTVNLTANLTGDGVTPVFVLTDTSIQTDSMGNTIPTVVNLTSNGALTQIHSNVFFGDGPAVLLDGSSRFTNAGTILVEDTAPSIYNPPLAAVRGSGTVINTGAITLSAADAIQGDGNPLTVVNSGTIEELSAGAGGRGIVFADTVTNTGAISTTGAAVILGDNPFGSGTVTNSGVINSATDAAVSSSTYGTAAVTNLSGGGISGQTYGVYIASGGSVTNAGLISGGVDSVYFGYGSNTLTLQTGSTLVGDAVASTTNGATNALILQGAGVAENNFINFTSLDVQGPGIWTLGGTSTIATTEVSGGTLAVAGVLTSAVDVAAGATLAGHGTVVGMVTNNGVVSPGGSVGVLTIKGDYTQTPGAALNILVAPGQSSELLVTGAATLAGALDFEATPGAYRKGEAFAFLTAGSISGAFTRVSTLDGLAVTLTGTSTGEVARLQAGDLGLSGATPNQSAIGQAVANVPTSVTDFDPVFNAIAALPPGAQQNAAVSALGGESVADLTIAARQETRAFLGQISQRIDADPLAGVNEHGGHVWIEGTGQSDQFRGDGNAHGFGLSGGGVVLGVDGGLDHATFGGALTYNHSSLGLDGLSQSADQDTIGLGGYGEERFGPWFINGAVSWDYERDSTQRTIVLPGVHRTATADLSGYDIGGTINLGGRFGYAGWRIQPGLGVVFNSAHLNAASEVGAGSADLSINSQSQSGGETLLGAVLERTFSVKDGAIDGQIRANWAHELGGLTPWVSEAFPAAPGTGFALAGDTVSRDAALIGVGLRYRAGRRWSVYARYDGGFSAAQTANAGSLGATLAW